MNKKELYQRDTTPFCIMHPKILDLNPYSLNFKSKI